MNLEFYIAIKCFNVLDRVMDAYERWEHWKARIMIFFSSFSNFSKFSRAFITALRTRNHGTPAVFWFILDISYVYLCGVLVFFQEMSGLAYFWTTLGDSPLFYRLSVLLRWNRSVSFYCISFSLAVYIGKLTTSIPQL